MSALGAAGGCEQFCVHQRARSSGRLRVAEIKRMAEQANTITAMLSTNHILGLDQQREAVLNCLSLADDFVRDLDVLAGAPA